IRNDAKGGPIPYEKQTSVRLAFGAGLKYEFLRSRWILRGDMDWYDRDAWYISVSVARFFGGEAEVPPRIVPRLDIDSDGDGVLDDDDRCPGTPEGETVDRYGCPVPADGDGDGVLDENDDCPATETAVPVDNRGCEIREEIRLPDVKFETNSDRLRPGSDRVLDDAAATLSKYSSLVVEVAGHTDDQGAASYNLGLSERRAKTVRDYLINRGVDASRLSWRGYGEEQPIADNATAEGREENRRVVLRILQRP
ncbi:MAG: OmpA family protein, partial [Woeseiaceae bacterium]